MKIQICGIRGYGCSPEGSYLSEFVESDRHPTFKQIVEAHNIADKFFLREGYKKIGKNSNPGFYEGIISTPTNRLVYSKGLILAENAIFSKTLLDSTTVFEVAFAGPLGELEKSAKKLKEEIAIPPSKFINLGTFESGDKFNITSFPSVKVLLEYLIKAN